MGPGSGRDDYPDNGRQLPPAEPTTDTNRANSRNQCASRSYESSCGNGSGKLGDRRSLSLPDVCRRRSYASLRWFGPNFRVPDQLDGALRACQRVRVMRQLSEAVLHRTFQKDLASLRLLT
jgi:hypothetical protein